MTRYNRPDGGAFDGARSMAIASPPAQPNLSTKFRAYLTETGVTGDRADALARKFDLYLAEREKQASAIPEDGSGFFGEALKGATRGTLNIAAGAASSGPSVIQYLGEAVAGANALPMQVLGGAANMLGMPTLGDAYQRTAEAVASKGIDISRAVGRGVANTPIMPAGGLTLPMMAQAPRALAQSKTLAPSDRAAADLAQMNNGTNFLPQTSAGWGSLTGEQLPALGLGFGAGLVGGPSVGVGVTSLAAGAQEYESTLAQLMQEFPGKSMDFYEGEAARKFIQTTMLESATEKLPLGEILEGKLAKMFIGKTMNKWPRWARVLMGQTTKAVTSAVPEGTEEVVSEGAGAVGDRLAGDPNAFQNLPNRMATAGIIGGAMSAGLGGITPGGFGTVPPQTPPTDRMGGRGPTQSRTPEITPRTPETTTATPDTSALDEAAALAEQRLNERAAPVGTPSPADQVASSRPEQDAGADEMYNQAIDAIMQQPTAQGQPVARAGHSSQPSPASQAQTTTPVQNPAPSARNTGTQTAGRGTGASDGSGLSESGSASPSPQSTREPWQMTRAEWVGGGTVGRIKFGDVDQEFVESPQFDTPEEAKAWAASRGIANAQIQSSGKRGGPKLYKASGSTSFHRDAVEAAHAAGKPVPPEVLAEYGLKPNPSESPNSSTQPRGGSRLLGTRNRDTEEMRRARQRVENRKFRAFGRRQVEQQNTARENINHGFSGKAAPAPITRAEAEAATTEDMQRLGQQVVESTFGEPYGKLAHAKLGHHYIRVEAVDYTPVDPTKELYAEHKTKVKQVEIWLAAEWMAQDQRDALLRTLKSAGYKKVTVNANENGMVVQFVPTNDDVISQPQGQDAATTNKERTNGEEEAPQARDCSMPS